MIFLQWNPKLLLFLGPGLEEIPQNLEGYREGRGQEKMERERESWVPGEAETLNGLLSMSKSYFLASCTNVP